ncbi:hypothetical protein AK812_SmicGene22998 [Symbiodinium microadriaticum]|uniref:Uncharacterized protein n=1 Tax=Symbiodinium microadriaticum TaxID=2951 RepID=A0A1Q9DIE6_SYMMI|nr:hypothetical protein AK812_SmicGene22998 [Symbiodinium microadriaticum]CAE7945218.1 unnamed protein product [Symbiodinium sp. KB8]
MHDGRSFTWEELEAEEERMERTPRSADRHGPAPPADHRPKGPPPPRPIHEHEDPACAQPVAGTGDRWERDHSLGPQPTAWVERDGKRTIARVSGPLLPNGRFEDDRREDQVDSSGSEDLVRELSEESAAATGDEANSTSGNSMSWSDTSLVLEGPSLRQARGPWLARWGRYVALWTEATGVKFKGWRGYDFKASVYNVGSAMSTRSRRCLSAYDAAAAERARDLPLWQGRLTARSSGVLLMLERRAFQDISVQELSPGHRPLHATLCLRPFRPLPPKTSGVAAVCDAQAIQAAVAEHSAQAEALRLQVEGRLQSLRPTGVQQAQQHINSILVEAARMFFPAAAGADDRVSAHPGYRASAKATWDLYARMKHPCHSTLPVVWHKWRLVVQFRRASKALRDQSRLLKKQKYQQQVAQAEQAAAAGDQRTLYQIVRRLAPKSFQGASRLLGPEGRLLSAEQELTAVLTYSAKTFASIPDEVELHPTEHSLDVSDQALAAEFGKLGLRKAVPAHVAPAAIWKLCGRSISAVLGPQLRQHFQAPAQASVINAVQQLHQFAAYRKRKDFDDAKSDIELVLTVLEVGIASTATTEWERQPLPFHMTEDLGNPEADIFRYCFPSGAPPQEGPSTHQQLRTPKRHRPEYGPPLRGYPSRHQPSYTAPPLDNEHLRLVSKILLQHEDSIQQIRQDRAFVMFMQEDQRSLLPAMMAMAKEWNLKKDKGDPSLVSPLRTVLMANVIKEILQRMQTVVATEEGRKALKQAQWLTDDGAWVYQKWCHKSRRLILDASRPALQHEEAVRLLNMLHSQMKGEIVQTFKSRQHLRKLEEQGATSAAFKLEISLRGQEATEVHEALVRFINNSVTGLVGMSLKRELPNRGPMSKQLAQLVYGN